MSNRHYAQIVRGFRSALAQAGIALTWTPPDAADPVSFRAIKNPVRPTENAPDRNSGDDTPCILTSLVTDLSPSAALPTQGESFIGDDALSYRIASVEYVPGHPLISFTCANVVTL